MPATTVKQKCCCVHSALSKECFLIGIHSMDLHEKETKRLKHTGNDFRKNLQLIDVCQL